MKGKYNDKCIELGCHMYRHHVLWCPKNAHYPHDKPDPYYQKILDKETKPPHNEKGILGDE